MRQRTSHPQVGDPFPILNFYVSGVAMSFTKDTTTGKRLGGQIFSEDGLSVPMTLDSPVFYIWQELSKCF